jgi:hypothetical protein
MSGRHGPVARDTIDEAFSSDPVETPAPPVSCAAVLAERMGASPLHLVMAASLAGGIGLSGSGCGALGTAIWMVAMRHNEASGGKILFDSPIGEAVVASFVKAAGPDLNCSAIAGRTFESLDDHAAYLRDGGCADMMDALVDDIQKGES